jgi:hypothetical protein
MVLDDFYLRLVNLRILNPLIYWPWLFLRISRWCMFLVKLSVSKRTRTTFGRRKRRCNERRLRGWDRMRIRGGSLVSLMGKCHWSEVRLFLGGNSRDRGVIGIVMIFDFFNELFLGVLHRVSNTVRSCSVWLGVDFREERMSDTSFACVYPKWA